MFQIGEFIIYENRGICKVEGIAELSLPGAVKGQQYYELKPVFDESGKYILPWTATRSRCGRY